jgi:phosphoglycerol transferase MdoB-like AlkP superfamily enzyme
MVAEAFVPAVTWPITAGLVASFAIEAIATPRPVSVWKRPVSALLIHVGLWLSTFTVLLAIVGRPWFAVAAMSAFLLLLILVNQAKLQSLREPFVFQDFEYFSDALRHPRLYLPFLGWGKAMLAGVAFLLAVYTGFSLEASLRDRVALAGFLYGVGGMAILSAGLLGLGVVRALLLTFDPAADVRQLGWLGSLWSYGRAERVISRLNSPQALLTSVRPTGALPHVVVVQSESFFDPRRVFPGIRSEVLEQFDALRAESCLSGPLEVPAWGANTVRTEFAFLSGLGETQLGVHKFNPYRKLQIRIPTIASVLKGQGYRTVCIHPYSASFYERDRIYPLLGFDEFIDIGHFSGAQRVGPFVSDLAVAEKLAAILKASTGQPVFLFVITMENHGPLHLESVLPEDIDRYHTTPPPSGCEDLTVYLRHLANASRMAESLCHTLNALPDDAWLTWFGDHVPIMPAVYSRLGAPDGRTEYLVWRKGGTHSQPHHQPLRAEDLGIVLLREMSFQ